MDRDGVAGLRHLERRSDAHEVVLHVHDEQRRAGQSVQCHGVVRATRGARAAIRLQGTPSGVKPARPWSPIRRKRHAPSPLPDFVRSRRGGCHLTPRDAWALHMALTLHFPATVLIFPCGAEEETC